jgi:hypothetical protein
MRASPFQAVKTWKTSTDPDYEAKKNRVLELYAIADGKREPGSGDPSVVICMDLCRHRDYAEVSVAGSRRRDDAVVLRRLISAGIGIVAG